MSQRLLFYVSGHGYGHARRVAQVIRAVLDRESGVEIHVRTAAPHRMFPMVPADRLATTEVDAGMAEDGPLVINVAGTLARLNQLIARRAEIVAHEAAVVCAFRPDLIVADIPFLAGDIAAAAGVPCVGVTNFTWDWICEPFLAAEPGFGPVLDVMREGYGKMTALLELPLGGTSDAFPKKVPVPLIASRSTRPRGEVLRQLGIDPADGRPLVLFGMRGGVPTEALARAAADAPNFRVLCPMDQPGEIPPPVVGVRFGPDLDFSDVHAACDVVVCKLGYGIIADSIALGVRMVWPRRFGFREDAIMEVAAKRFTPMLEISHEAFRAGLWGDALRRVMALQAATESIRTDGAAVCAEMLLN